MSQSPPNTISLSKDDNNDTPRMTWADHKLLWMLGLFCLVFWGATCGLWDLRGEDECRYVQISRELTERSDWLRLTVHGRPYDQKPPLAFWTMAVMLEITQGHVSSWAARLPSVLAGVGTVLLTWLIGFWASAGNRRTATYSALILLTAPLFTGNVPQAELNIQYTFWTTAALYLYLVSPAGMALSPVRAALFWLALACAFFTKGPLAILIVFLVIAAHAKQSRSWKTILRVRPLPGTLFLALTIGGWLYAQRIAYGEQFVANQVRGETLNRFLQGDHSEPFWYYFPRLLTSFFPWGFILPFAAYWFWKGRTLPNRKRLILLAAWALLPFVLLCLASGKRQNYLLPLFPAISILLGTFLSSRETSWVRKSTPGNIAVGFTAIAGVALLVLSSFPAIWPEFLTKRELTVGTWMIAVWIAAGLVLLTTSAGLSRSKQASAARNPVYVVSAVMLFLSLVRFTTYEPALDPHTTTRQFADTIDAMNVRAMTTLGKASHPEFHIYGEYEVLPATRRDLEDPEEFMDHVLTTARDAPECSATLVQSGFEPSRNFHVSEDDLILFIRRKGILPGEPESFLPDRLMKASAGVVTMGRETRSKTQLPI